MTDLPPTPEGFPPPVPPGADAPPAYPAPGAYPVPGQYPPPPPYGVPPQYAPGGYPAQGYQVPGGVPMYNGMAFASDPLVTPVFEGFAGWWSRLWKTFARSWRSLVVIIGLTVGLPGVVIALVIAGPMQTMTDRMRAFQLVQQQDPSAGFPPALLHSFGTVFGLAAVLSFMFLIPTAVGWTATIWVITKQAAGEPAPLGRALAYGLRSSPRTFGWLLLYFLMVIVGSVCCVLPGLYFMVAGGLIVPLVVFSRGSISDSFRMVNRNFGAVLGRLLTAYAVVVGFSIVALIVGFIAGVVASAVGSGGTQVPQIVETIVGIPGNAILIIGITLTFAEMRAREMPTTTEALNQAL